MRNFLKECLSKKVYKCYRDAHDALKRAERQRGTKLRIYQCTSCGHYHLTKQAAA